MNKSAISWTGRTWNPFRGCKPRSRGCADCYAMSQAHRINKQFLARGWAAPYDRLVKLVKGKPVWTGEVKVVKEKLVEPLGIKDGATIFVNSMSDLFYDGFKNEEIGAVFGVIAAASWHTFQVLTKREDCLVEWFTWVQADAASRGVTPAQLCFMYARQVAASDPGATKVLNRAECIITANKAAWPLPNVWIGVSVEDQKAANLRMPMLVKVPAAVRFVSAEPLLELVDLSPWLADIGWVIGGCESGDNMQSCDAA